jgi:hypothetical protein
MGHVVRFICERTIMVKVIGTGFGRTGTDSMREALNLLGFGPCHHMRDLLADAAHRDLWRELNANLDGPEPIPSWGQLLGGYGSCIDWPSAAYWPLLVDAFPEAKVLLTYRTAESWWRSFEKTILPLISVDPSVPQPRGSDMISGRVFGGKLERDHCIAVYEANVARVKREVPAERLLVHTIGDGWEPLCEFLNAPVPSVAYPRSNSTDDFNREHDKGK